MKPLVDGLKSWASDAQPLQLEGQHTLRQGSRGDDVKKLQQMLNQQLGADLEVDGKFGPKTRAAVEKLQEQRQLDVDGIVGRHTRGALNEWQPGGTPPVQQATPPDTSGLHQAAQSVRPGDGVLQFKAGAAIDTDGSGRSHGDDHHRDDTSLTLRGGTYPNADKTDYFVLPPSVADRSGAQLGDLGLITYNGKTIPAVYADTGPDDKLGEISYSAANKLGINSHPNTGGVEGGVQYTVFPGSGGGRTPSARDITPEALAARVKQLLAARQASGL